ncbi:MAG: competence protein CoiA family protein [Candidatus Poribacteria bacterium]|nr:competence protein CoiA family protein [Candidatus Poribacteria bacterium]
MPFTAIREGRRVNSLRYKESEWEELKESEREYRTLKCPECKADMIARAGINTGMRPHFAHRFDLIENAENNLKPCSLRSESNEHLFIKQRGFEICKSLGLGVETEQRIQVEGGVQIADICVPDKKKIVEIQISSQQDNEYRRRHEEYREAGYETLWITWKKAIRYLPIAKISIRSRGNELRNKKNITSAEQFMLLITSISYMESKYIGYEVGPMEVSRNFLELIKMYMFDEAHFTKSCGVCNQPHWCGEACSKADVKMAKFREEEKKEEREKLLNERRATIHTLKMSSPEIYESLATWYSSELQSFLSGENIDYDCLLDRVMIETDAFYHNEGCISRMSIYSDESIPEPKPKTEKVNVDIWEWLLSR